MFSFSYFLKVSPHILNYGRVDEATKSLKFPLSRPCDEGEQCFLSYGKHPGSHLVTFYGFLPRGDNPYDVIPLGNLLRVVVFLAACRSACRVLNSAVLPMKCWLA